MTDFDIAHSDAVIALWRMNQGSDRQAFEALAELVREYLIAKDAYQEAAKKAHKDHGLKVTVAVLRRLYIAERALSAVVLP